MITWRRLGERDFPLLKQWLEQPHVARWWNHATSNEAIARDFGAAIRGEEPSEDLLTFLDGRPLGLVQRCRLADYPEYLAKLTAIAEVPHDTMTIDYLIGDPQQVGRGLGTQMIQTIVQATWADHPTSTSILVPVSAANRASWRALEKAGPAPSSRRRSEAGQPHRHPNPLSLPNRPSDPGQLKPTPGAEATTAGVPRKIRP